MPQWFELELLSSRSEVPRARGFVVDVVRTVGRGDMVDLVELLTSELATNAVLHGGGDTVSIIVVWDEPKLRVEVRDQSPLAPQARTSFSAEAATGRGMLLVSELADKWGTTEHPGDGKTVWFELASASADLARR